ncbi:MAG: 4Fe-4S dicluster domain-containing protein [Candidatus Bathyarchaeia archaeon]
MHEVANTPRGKGVLSCIQCGRCSSSCPVARLIDEHNPRRLMEMIILGLRSEVLSQQLPWYCLSCFTCLDRCPQGGDVGEAMFAIRNIAVEEGKVPAGVIAQARNLIETGRVVNPTAFMISKRQKMGLSKGPSTATEDVQKILKKTAFDKIVASGGR